LRWPVVKFRTCWMRSNSPSERERGAPLRANLNTIASLHRDSVLLLSLFVDEMRKGILKNAFSWMKSINEAIEAAQTGDPPHPLIDPHESR
jgi:hypothetical protein